MGLNEVYTVIRGSILLMNPLPSIAQAFFLLVQNEKQREMRPSNQLVIGSTALNAGTQGVRGNFNTSTSGSQGNFRTNYSANYNYSSGNMHLDLTVNFANDPDTLGKEATSYMDILRGLLKNSNHQSMNYSQNFRVNKGKRPMANAHSAFIEEPTAREGDLDVQCSIMIH